MSNSLHYFIVFLRKEIQKRTERDDYTEVPTSDAARIVLHIVLRKYFPDTAKDRDFRLGILMALTGIPLSSQKDLPAAYTHVVIEALNDNLSRDLTGMLSDQLTAFVKNPSCIFPWKILDAGYTNVDLPNLRPKDDKEHANGSSRGPDRAVTSPGQSVCVANQPQV
jgi:hypothetical protein